MIVKPASPIANGSTFTVLITDFTAAPTKITWDVDSVAFFVTPDGSATAPQPYDAHLIYPCNDHPRDKATFTFTIDVPAGRDAVANGVQTGHTTADGRTIWTYRMAQPMATELTQIAVGDWDFGPTTVHDGVAIRNVTAPAITAAMQPVLELTEPQLDWMIARVGPYPFDTYGTLVVNALLYLQMETQTMMVTYADLFERLPRDFWEPAQLHELAHIWFGDSVSPYSWSDYWLNEGHATWYQWTYAEDTGQLVGADRGPPGSPGVRDARRADARDVCARRRMAQEVRTRRASQERRCPQALQLSGLLRWGARPLRAPAEDRELRRSSNWSERGSSGTATASRARTISSRSPRRSAGTRA